MVFVWGRLEHPASNPRGAERADGIPREMTDSRSGDDTRTPTQSQRAGTHQTIIYTHRDNYTGKRKRIDHNPKPLRDKQPRAKIRPGGCFYYTYIPIYSITPIHIDHLPTATPPYRAAEDAPAPAHKAHTSASRETGQRERGKQTQSGSFPSKKVGFNKTQ